MSYVSRVALTASMSSDSNVACSRGGGTRPKEPPVVVKAVMTLEDDFYFDIRGFQIESKASKAF